MENIRGLRKHVWIVIYSLIAVVVIVLNAVAWNSTTFCDWYIARVFPIWVNTYGRFTGWFPFSVGELMLLLAMILGGVALVFWLPALLYKKLRKAAGIYYKFVAWTVLIVCLIMTLNCFILYHATTFSETYFGTAKPGAYSSEDLVQVRNMVVEACNELSGQMERDPEGNIVYDGDLREQAVASMKKLGKTYDRLDGFYPKPKPLYASDFFSQQYMCGYYFPFSMEANYNDVMYIMNMPSTLCHELAHLKGYIFEDEANFIGFLACVDSEDPLFQYSGYLSVLNYLDNDFYKSVGRDRELYLQQPIISEQVKRDNVFVTEKEWERINAKAVIATETVEKVSDIVVDTTLKVNGVHDGSISYSRVVELLLLYYRASGI